MSEPTHQQPPPVTLSLGLAAVGAGVGERCDIGCGLPIAEGQSVVRAVPAAMENGPAVYGHEVCFLRHQNAKQGHALAQVQRSLVECHQLLACVVAGAGGCARVRPIDVQRARDAGFELDITDTPDKGKKLVLKRAPVIVVPSINGGDRGR